MIKNLNNSEISVYNNHAFFNMLTVYGNSFKKIQFTKILKDLEFMSLLRSKN